MIKKKIEVHYRKAKKADIKERRCCWYCQNILLMPIKSCASGPSKTLKNDYRCKIIGKENSRRYTIGINNTCDKFNARKPGTLPEGSDE